MYDHGPPFSAGGNWEGASATERPLKQTMPARIGCGLRECQSRPPILQNVGQKLLETLIGDDQASATDGGGGQPNHVEGFDGPSDLFETPARREQGRSGQVRPQRRQAIG
ncbi:hypothetical protein X739_33510 [Mesorhizobium sp. LNHC220B00]|nr:hypothetical protein [Mesorhizobium sp. LNHC220B00]ESY76882.1 hypothetical protein X739_33510 [Mesorhizobium sp. LNHC220B00]